MIDPLLFVFIILTLVIVFPLTPFKWALLGYLILIHINLVENNFTSATSIGIENAIKVVVLPTILLIRTRVLGFKLAQSNFAFWLWIAFGIYITIAASWSPLKLPAIKQIGFFYAYTVIWLVFVWAFKENRSTTTKIIAASFVAAFIIAVIQTFLLGNAENQFGGLDNRFTSFTASQNFALYLALVLIFVCANFAHPSSTPSKWILIFLILISVILNASRTNIAALIVILTFVAFLWGTSKRAYGPITLVTGALSFSALLVLFLIIISTTFSSSEFTAIINSNRTLQLLGVLNNEFTLDDIGTAQFRTNIYATLLDQIKQKPMNAVFFGSGTSSTGELITQGLFTYRDYNENTVDANRLAHNEFLRALYEWGVIGLTIFLAFLGSVTMGTFYRAIKLGTFKIYTLSTSFIVLFLFLMLENVLAGSAGPGGVMISVLLADLTTTRSTS